LFYNSNMKIPPAALNVLLEDAIARDRITARRATLLEILLQERYLIREQLIVRIEGKLGKGCFGDSAWVDTFFRDMKIVKQALSAAGYQLAYSRRQEQPGYYLRNQPPLSPELSFILESCVNEVDRTQMAIYKQLSFAQRFQQGCSISNLARRVVAYRIRKRNPGLDHVEANRLALLKTQ